MRIAIDARQVVRPEIGRVSGVNEYTSQIIREMAQCVTNDTLLLFVDQEVTCEDLGISSDCQNIEIHQSAGVLHSVPFVGAHLKLPLQIHKEEVDVFFSPTGLLPLGLSVPSVAFIHDLLILEHPEWFPDTALQQLFTLKLVLPKSVARARRLVVPSRVTKEDVRRHFSYVKTQIDVVPEGVLRREPNLFPLTQALREKFGIKDRYIVSIGTVEPRKNLVTAIRAFEQFLTTDPSFARDVQFVMAGKEGWAAEPVLKLIEEVNHRWRQYQPGGVVLYLGMVEDEERWVLYQNADVYLCTSLAEGFGLPPLEAMSVGTPVITTPVGAVADYGEDVVVQLLDTRPEMIAVEIRTLMKDEARRRRLGEKGLERARELTWKRAAKRTLEILKEVGSDKKGLRL